MISRDSEYRSNLTQIRTSKSRLENYLSVVDESNIPPTNFGFSQNRSIESRLSPTLYYLWPFRNYSLSCPLPFPRQIDRIIHAKNFVGLANHGFVLKVGALEHGTLSSMS